MTVPIEDGPRRTDPRSFAVRAISMLGQLVLPILFGAFAILDEGDLGDLALYFVPLVLVAVGANMAFAYLRWRRLTYTVGEADIRVESGILSRAARSVPYERIQDVSLEQKPVPRLFGLVEVKFETGAGGGDDLALTYLTQGEGERLRELVRARRDGTVVASDSTDTVEADSGRLLFAMSPKRVVTFGLFEGRPCTAVRFPTAIRSVGLARLARAAVRTGSVARGAGLSRTGARSGRGDWIACACGRGDRRHSHGFA